MEKSCPRLESQRRHHCAFNGLWREHSNKRCLDRIKAVRQRCYACLWEAKRFQANFTQAKSQILTWQLGISRIQSVQRLAIFLDRYFEGKELAKPFEKAKIEIVPKERGKEIKSHAITWIFLNVVRRVLLPQVPILWVLKRNIRVCYRLLMMQP